jgi:hypothetical protein
MGKATNADITSSPEGSATSSPLTRTRSEVPANTSAPMQA